MIILDLGKNYLIMKKLPSINTYDVPKEIKRHSQ